MKKLVSILTAAAVVFGAMASCAEEKQLMREEIPSADTEISALAELQIMKGTENGLEPERPVTRAESLALISRTVNLCFNDIAWLNCPFSDIEGHWAYSLIESFCVNGLAQGRDGGIFDPDGTVSGREFVKLLLSSMGYTGVTIENAYEKGIDAQLLMNNFTKSVVKEDYRLLRSDAARLCFSALTAAVPEGGMLYQRLISQGAYSKEDFEGVLYAESAEASFADRLNAVMPKDKNYMFSPLSVKMAFAMAANGADGETRSEILEACGISDLDSFDEAARDMIKKYSETDFLKLDISNSIWLNEENTAQKFAPDFQKRIEEYYGGKASTVNNSNAVETINGWVKEKTNGKINGIIDSSDFASALVNAIYFKGAWADDFYEGATEKGEFTNADGVKASVDFMHKTDYMSYAEKDGLQIVRLPYTSASEKISEDGEYLGTETSSARISMYILLGDGNVENPESIVNNPDGFDMERTYVALSLPKFKTEFSINLSETMKGLGVKRAFEKNAEFEKMFDSGSGFISDVLHKTYINVDEKGTEAAAVTAVMVATTALVQDPVPIEMKADHPFTYVIMDDSSGEVLFVGRYAFAE